jgi:transposase-like protein
MGPAWPAPVPPVKPMTGHGTKFTRKQEQAIAALLSSRSVEEAAKSIDLSPSTLLRWLAIAEFRGRYLDARRHAVHQAVARLQQDTGVASVAILKLMTDPSVPAAVRLRAAEVFLNTPSRGSNGRASNNGSRHWSRRR